MTYERKEVGRILLMMRGSQANACFTISCHYVLPPSSFRRVGFWLGSWFLRTETKCSSLFCAAGCGCGGEALASGMGAAVSCGSSWDPLLGGGWYQLFAPLSLGSLLGSVARHGDLPRGGVLKLCTRGAHVLEGIAEQDVYTSPASTLFRHC